MSAHHPTTEAQELYLRGRYYWNLRTEQGLNCALDLFTQSIVNDPHYAEAYAGLADAYLLLRQYGHMRDAEAYPRALAAARQAIALDDSSPGAHRSLAFILRFWNWDMAAAEKEYRRAIELNPNDSQSHHWYATALLSSNRYREALTQIDMARRLEPQSVSVMADRGLVLSMMDVHAGMAALKQTEEAEPGFVSTHIYLAGDYLRAEDYANFLAESRTAAELSHNAAMVAVLDSGRKALAQRGPRAMLREIAERSAPLADHGSAPAYPTARYFGLSGEPGEALRYLRLACERREPGFLAVEDDPAFTQLRAADSAEFKTLVSRRDVATGSGKQPIARLDMPTLP
jgi:tetratricopeptide (TPR) repeat protein